MKKMPPKIKIIFRWSGYNTYTLSILIGLLLEKLDPKKFVITTCESLKQIIQEIKDRNYRTIVAYSFCTPQAENAQEEIHLLKKMLKDKITIICGGPHTTALPQSALKAGADFVFSGEAEESLPAFMQAFYASTSLKKDNVIQPLPLKNFDSYPPFAYKINYFGPIEIRRGCINRCSFCQTPRIFTGIRQRSIEYVKRYANYIKEAKRKVIFFLIADALSYGAKGNNVNLSHLEKFLKEMHNTGLKVNLGNFPSEISPQSLTRFPDAAFILKKYVTNRKIILGGQSGSSRILKLMNRNHNVTDIINSAKILKDNGFIPIVDMLFGIPGEKKKDRNETIKLINSLIKKFNAIISIHYFLPLPGTPFANTRPQPIENDIKEKLLALLKTKNGQGRFSEQLKFSQKSIAIT